MDGVKILDYVLNYGKAKTVVVSIYSLSMLLGLYMAYNLYNNVLVPTSIKQAKHYGFVAGVCIMLLFHFIIEYLGGKNGD